MHDLREDQAQIGELLVRYATGIDRRDWTLFRACWTDDAEACYGGVRYRGADAVTEYMTLAHRDLSHTFHRMSNFVIDVDGDTATARSYVHAVLMLAESGPDAWVDVVGYYDDLLVRTGAGWRISRRTSVTPRVLTSAAGRAAAARSASC